MAKIAVVEDTLADNELIVQYLNQFAEEENISITYDCFNSGLEFLDSFDLTYDIILLDINMPHMDGLDVAKKIREQDGNVPLIFITSMAKCAINGYEVEALAFLLKPVKYADFARAIRKALRLSDSATHCIIVKTGGGLKKIQTTDITFLEVRNNTVYINTENKEVIPVRMTLTELEKQIGGGAFVRCNNCYLVNLRYVTDVIGDTVKVNGSELVISRHRKKPFLDALTLYYGRR